MSKTITADEFRAQYKPVKNLFTDNAPFNGCMFETYGAELLHVQETVKVSDTFVWTILDNDSITSGYYHINRLGYLITEMPCDQDFIDVVVTNTDNE